MREIAIQWHKTPFGELVLGACDARLCLLDFRYRKQRQRVDQRLCQGLAATFVERDDAILDIARVQLEQYFRRERQYFDLPIQLVGSHFQQRVWRTLMAIPYGETASYAAMAQAIGQPSAVRAVASANGANALALIIPCHRVIGSDGRLVGYGGGLAVKQRLLQLESPQLF